MQPLLLSEYSVPWELLPELVERSGDLVVVAGPHAVEPAAVRAKVYSKLGAPMPRLGQAVGPIIGVGRILGLQTKLHAARQVVCRRGRSKD